MRKKEKRGKKKKKKNGHFWMGKKGAVLKGKIRVSILTGKRLENKNIFFYSD